MKCKVGAWLSTLDGEDRKAFKAADGRISRADLYATVCAAHGGKPYSLTCLKDHLNSRCVCN